MWHQYVKNPNGFAYLRKLCMPVRISKKEVFLDCIHYVSSSIFARNIRFVKESPKKVLTILAVPFGVVLNIVIRFKTRGG
jgi:hypothetical protein